MLLGFWLMFLNLRRQHQWKCSGHTLPQQCLRLEKSLTGDTENDIDICGMELLTEIKSVVKVITRNMIPLEVLSLLYDVQLVEFYPNLCIALCIFFDDASDSCCL